MRGMAQVRPGGGPEPRLNSGPLWALLRAAVALSMLARSSRSREHACGGPRATRGGAISNRMFGLGDRPCRPPHAPRPLALTQKWCVQEVAVPSAAAPNQPPSAHPPLQAAAATLLVLLLAAAATPAAATGYYGAYSSRRLSSVRGAYYGAYGNRRLTGAPVQPTLLPAARRLFSAGEPHSVPVPARLAAASRALTGYGYYAVRGAWVWLPVGTCAQPAAPPHSSATRSTFECPPLPCPRPD